MVPFFNLIAGLDIQTNMGLNDHKLGLLALGMLAICGLLFLVGFSTPAWYTQRGLQSGLWISCPKPTGKCSSVVGYRGLPGKQ